MRKVVKLQCRYSLMDSPDAHNFSAHVANRMPMSVLYQLNDLIYGRLHRLFSSYYGRRGGGYTPSHFW